VAGSGLGVGWAWAGRGLDALKVKQRRGLCNNGKLRSLAMLVANAAYAEAAGVVEAL
jgi:hypothetical protein